MHFSNYPATIIIIAINIIIFILINLKVLHISDLGSSYIDTIQKRQPYRIVTSAFTQQEFLHIAMNMYSLYNIGHFLERLLETWLFVLCYAVIMVVGGFFAARLRKKNSPFTISIGASGVICGLLGIYVVIAYSALGFSGLSSLAPTFIFLVLMTFNKRIDSLGHLTGLLTGIVCGIVITNIYTFTAG